MIFRSVYVWPALAGIMSVACGATSLDAEHLYTPFVCDPGTADCDGRFSTGCETDLRERTDCGGCGVTCAAHQICASGVCMAP